MLLASAGVLPLAALQIRGYDAARHNRFTNFPTAPAANPGFLFGPNQFTGVGWDTSLANRQFALVSPRHFVCASHYPPPPGTIIRFLNASGTTVDRVVQSTAAVPDDDGKAGDLALGLLTEPLTPADGVTPFPYLNLTAEEHARGIALETFGKTTSAGRASLEGFADLEASGIPPTRSCFFIYFGSGSHPDDCRLEGGDSGSPTFARIAGMPALLGTHSAIDVDGGDTTNHDTYLPHYLHGLNSRMNELGYQMQPALAAPAAIIASTSTQPPALRQAQAATLWIDLQNPTSNDTADVAAEFDFSASTRPDTIAPAAGWTTDENGPDHWRFRCSLLAAGGQARFTATWQKLPSVDHLDGELRLQSTTAPDGLRLLRQAVLPSYAAWSEGLADDQPGADPDRDGVANLLEYAFGGDPSSASRQMTGGPPLLPTASLEASGLVVTFPERTDAAARGLTCVVEFTTDLTEGSWDDVPPANSWVEAVPFDPPVAGFLSRRVHCPPEGPALFCRVRVELEE